MSQTSLSSRAPINDNSGSSRIGPRLHMGPAKHHMANFKLRKRHVCLQHIIQARGSYTVVCKLLFCHFGPHICTCQGPLSRETSPRLPSATPLIIEPSLDEQNGSLP